MHPPCLAACEPSSPPAEDSELPFTVWSDDVWDTARAAQAAARLAATGPYLSAHQRRSMFEQRIGKMWDQYYASHGDRGFRDRHYLERDFPQLFASGGGGRAGSAGGGSEVACGASGPDGADGRSERPLTLLELGCGVGNAFFPLMGAVPRLFVTAFDLSRRAMTHIAAHPLAASGRVCAFVHNAAEGGTAVAVRCAHEAFCAADAGRDGRQTAALTAATAPYRRILPLASFAAAVDVGAWGEGEPAAGRSLFVGFDAALVLFMASALPPEALAGVFHEAAVCLAPGGVLLFRDYGAFDEAELRFRPGRRLGEHLFVRSDGTLAAFFTREHVLEAAARAGLEVVEARYLYRTYSNRATGQRLRRVFLHAVLRAPGASAALGGAPAALAAGVRTSPLAAGEGDGSDSPNAGAPGTSTSGRGEGGAGLAVGCSEYEWLRDTCQYVGVASAWC